MAPQAITQVLRDIPRVQDGNLLVGTDTHDDGGVYRLTDEIALVQTMDFFPPVVDNPFVYGQIAAANALSDVYAMGGVPKTALNLVGYPDDKLEFDWLEEILRGGAERCMESGTVIVGGHTVRDVEIKFGLSVTGVVHPDHIWPNAEAKPGDKLVLTKALGTGFVTTAHKARDCPEATLKSACESMVQLNRIGQEAAAEIGGIHAVTDVTGFGLAGHGYEVAQGSGMTLVIQLSQLPMLPGVEELVKRRYLTRASKSNAAYVAEGLQIEGEVDPVRLEIFYDAQTSGGLLISVEADRADALVSLAKEKGAPYSTIIGEVRERTTPNVGLLLQA